MSTAARTWGATVLQDGRTCFRLWAPECAEISLRISGRPDDIPMQPLAAGWHELTTRHAPPGSQYSYRMPDGRIVADPASLYQPNGVWGASEVIDLQQYAWAHSTWTGLPWTEAVLYELHVGTFTPQGTFRAIIDKLPHFALLGVTAIELMPVATFAGTRNWGYDGVFPYAPAQVYGRPEDLQALVDAAHGAGIMVFLDVVYNHFGPEGNMLSLYASSFFTERHQTPWGAGINFDGEPAVRQFFIDNALYWLNHYRLDGLRLDAVHAIADDSPQHIIDEISARVRRRYARRTVHLLLENENNEAHRLERHAGAAIRFTAQWNDDLHHVLHVAATNESAGYYGDYLGDRGKLARAIAEGFAFQGQMMPYQQAPRGEPSAHLPPSAFVGFIQNHDQVGNRAGGERLSALAPAAALRAVAAVYLLMPQIPMLFMGEEWGAEQPFPFFCDFTGDLGRAVVKGRREEFARFPEFAAAEHGIRIPDPLSPATYAAARLRWDDIVQTAHRETLAWYRAVIAARRCEIAPRLPYIQRGGRFTVLPGGIIRVNWAVGDIAQLTLVANLNSRSAPTESRPAGVRLWQEGEWNDYVMGPWSVHWSIEENP